MDRPAFLVLEDGREFNGIAVGASGVAKGEVVFNTAMTGYQEILTDPSYARQLVTLTYPQIGNVGTNPFDNESSDVVAEGLILKALPRWPASNWRSSMPLGEYLSEKGCVAIAGLDTRALTHHIRQQGALRGVIVADDAMSRTDAVAAAQDIPSLAGQDLAKVVTTEKQYSWTQPAWLSDPIEPKGGPHIVAIDFGVKRSILRWLVSNGATVTVVPAKSTASEILALKPDGVLLSNGPGDPQPCTYAIETIQNLMREKMPLMGICLGFQLLGLALGGQTKKMKFGHHGGNHPVQDCRTNRVLITAQNHGFCVDEASLPKDITVTHRSLFDGTLQGFMDTERRIMGFQGHPEAGPGPEDALTLFTEFMSMIR